MAVPTFYAKLLEFSKGQPLDEQLVFKEVMSKMRLHVSGSAALPEPGE
jgi:hypothetical protein